MPSNVVMQIELGGPTVSGTMVDVTIEEEVIELMPGDIITVSVEDPIEVEVLETP